MAHQALGEQRGGKEDGRSARMASPSRGRLSWPCHVSPLGHAQDYRALIDPANVNGQHPRKIPSALVRPGKSVRTVGKYLSGERAFPPSSRHRVSDLALSAVASPFCWRKRWPGWQALQQSSWTFASFLPSANQNFTLCWGSPFPEDGHPGGTNALSRPLVHRRNDSPNNDNSWMPNRQSGRGATVDRPLRNSTEQVLMSYIRIAALVRVEISESQSESKVQRGT